MLLRQSVNQRVACDVPLQFAERFRSFRAHGMERVRIQTLLQQLTTLVGADFGEVFDCANPLRDRRCRVGVGHQKL